MGTRQQAKELGQARYETGKPCKRGHISERETTSGKCVGCRGLYPHYVNNNAYQRQWRLDNPERIRVIKYRSRYSAELTAIRPKPDKCEICEKSHPKIVFDHCHQTGQFRGWLCDPCNYALGAVRDDVTVLERMIAYLKR